MPDCRSILITAGLLLVAAAARGNANRPPVVAVFDLEDKGAGLTDDLRDRLGDYLSTKLASTGAFEIVPRDQLRAKLLEQKKASYKLCFEQTCQIELGRELAAEKSLSTQVILLGSKCTVTSSLYDLRKSAASVGATAEGNCTEDGIVDSIEAVVAGLAGALAGRPQATPIQTPFEIKESAEERFRINMDDPAWQNALATETELIGIRLLGGITPDAKGTMGGIVSVYTLKWKYFSLTPLEFGGGYGGEGAISFGLVGVRPSFPLYFGDRGQHQIRIGLGLGYGGMTIAPKPEDAAGFALWPTVSYVYKNLGQLYFGASLQALIVPAYFDSRILDGGDALIFSLAFEFGWTGLPD